MHGFVAESGGRLPGLGIQVGVGARHPQHFGGANYLSGAVP
ncbi:MAG: hypothetical protein QNJ51_08745 [Calothrix sp. MO_167.B12]|nr:hypothetical protein [Calothrix sp. MO_167.B12]